MARQSKPHWTRDGWRTRIDGRTYYLGRDERKARAKFHRLMARRLDPPDGTRPATIAGAMDVWLRLHPNPKHLTWLRSFTVFAGRVYLDDVTDDLLHNYHDYLLRATYRSKDKNGEPHGGPKHYSRETIRDYMGDAVTVMRMAARRKWCDLPEVPALAKPEFVDRSIDPATLWAKLDAMPKRAGRILRFIAATGCRPSEARKLTWEQVHLPHRVCIIPRHKTSKKTGEPRIIALSPEALAALREVPRVGEHVFLSRFHKPYTRGGLRSISVKHLGITPYDLRHAFAQRCIDDGMAPEIVAKALGHKTSRMVWTYARIRDEQLIAAVSKLRLRAATEAG